MTAGDSYRIQRALPEEAAALYNLTMQVWNGVENKETFAVGKLGLKWFEDHLGPRGFGVTARSEDGTLAGILVVCIPGLDEENLGYDVAMDTEQLMRTCNMDTAAVLPEHRGHGLEYRMLQYAEEMLTGTDYRYLMATISPLNPPSLRTAEKLGYRVLATKEKYGGFLRNVLAKPINGGKLEDIKAWRERNMEG